MIGFFVALGSLSARGRCVRRVDLQLALPRDADAAAALLRLVRAADFWSGFAQSWFTPFMAAWITLSLNEAAYLSEIIRAGLMSVDPGQELAGRALGMSRRRIMRRIIVPQAIRIAIPPIGNEFITLLKLTSLASIISLHELLTAANQLTSAKFIYNEPLLAALVYYLVIVSILMALQARLERRFTWTSRGRGPRRRSSRRSMPMSVLRATDVSKSYGDLEVLHGVTFEIEPGQVKAIIGPSGSGKSTLLRCLALLEQPDRGTVTLGDAPPGPGEVGMVFQRFNLFQNMTALDNVMCGLVEVRRLSKDEAREQARAFLERVGLADKAAQYPGRALGRPAAARRDRARARDAAEGDALRRADVRARHRARARGARRDGVARARGDDDGRRHARDALRAARRELGADDGRGPDRRGGAAGPVLLGAEGGADAALPRARRVKLLLLDES